MTPTTRELPEVTLHSLPRNEASRVAHLQLPPAQRGFVGPIAEMASDPDPLQDFFCVRAVVQSGAPRVVGFFKVDRAFERRDPRLPTGAHGLRGLLIGGQFQRFGFGSALLADLPAFLSTQYPDIKQLYLSVDAANSPAIRAYGAHGWTETGLAPYAGRSGPEQVMRLALPATKDNLDA